MALFDGLEISRDTLEQANPVFNTAKMTLFQLAAAGDADAAAISEKLGLTMEQTQNGANSVASPEQLTAGALTMENRFRTMGVLADRSGCDVHVDLPCGYTPRAIHSARAGKRFVGLDLPAVIGELEGVISSLLTAAFFAEGQRRWVSGSRAERVGGERRALREQFLTDAERKGVIL